MVASDVIRPSGCAPAGYGRNASAAHSAEGDVRGTWNLDQPSLSAGI